MGRRTCESASALSLDAQPAQFERLVNRIWRPDGALAMSLMQHSFLGLKILCAAASYRMMPFPASGRLDSIFSRFLTA
jgi:hypothetical protein